MADRPVHMALVMHVIGINDQRPVGSEDHGAVPATVRRNGHDAELAETLAPIVAYVQPVYVFRIIAGKRHLRVVAVQQDIDLSVLLAGVVDAAAVTAQLPRLRPGFALVVRIDPGGGTPGFAAAGLVAQAERNDAAAHRHGLLYGHGKQSIIQRLHRIGQRVHLAPGVSRVPRDPVFDHAMGHVAFPNHR